MEIKKFKCTCGNEDFDIVYDAAGRTATCNKCKTKYNVPKRKKKSK